MVTRKVLKAEIDKIQDKYFDVLYKIIKALESPADQQQKSDFNATNSDSNEPLNWHQFIEETYGCLADALIEHGHQGKFEIRERIE